MEARVLWEPDDGWCDLAAIIMDAGEATAVSADGTAWLFRFGSDGAHRTRIPLEGGHATVDDLRWRRLDQLVGGPCGLMMRDRTGDHSDQSAPVRLVLAGLWPQWVTLTEGLTTIAAVIDREPLPVPAGHPEGSCGAAYCLDRYQSR